MRWKGLVGMLVISLVALAGCKDDNKPSTTITDASVDGRQGTVTDSQVQPMKDASPDRAAAMDGKVDVASSVDTVAIDAFKDAPVVDAPVDAAAVDSGGDALLSADAPVRCPASAPGEYSSPCPAGALCEYSKALQCDAGCSGGTYLRYECINNIWTITRRTAGAPVCYCPPLRG